VKAFDAFFAGELSDMKAHIKEAKDILAGQTAMLDEMSEKAVIVKGPRNSLPAVGLFINALKQIDMVLNELEILCAVRSYAESQVVAGDGSAWRSKVKDVFWESVMDTVTKTLTMMQLTIECNRAGEEAYLSKHGLETTTKISKDRLESRWNLTGNSAADSLCIAVATRALLDAETALFEIQHLCYSEGEFPLKLHEDFDLNKTF